MDYIKVGLVVLFYEISQIQCFHLYEFHFVNINKTWMEAQQHCRKMFKDLATISSVDDLSRLSRPTSYTGHAWIGLRDDPASWQKVMNSDPNSWRWSATGAESASQFQKWKDNKPENANGNSLCVFMIVGVWVDTPCKHTFNFVCFTGSVQGSKQYTLVPLEKTWEEAVVHCRQNYTDLAMIETEDENAEVAALVSSGKAWIGLNRKPWVWSDGSGSTFTNWDTKQPNNADGTEHCAVEQADHFWNDVSCGERYPFFCREELNKRTTLVRVKLQH